MRDTSPLELDLRIDPQPDEETCGPTSLHSVYRYYGDDISHRQVCAEVIRLPSGGTLSVYLALHALARGYRTTIYTCNVQLFDPTWFAADPEGSRSAVKPPGADGSATGAAAIIGKLRQQERVKTGGRLHRATQAYCDYLERGGRLFMEDITPDLLAEPLRRGYPIIAGLSATWLYRAPRERPTDWRDDDVAGEPLGHFVVLHGMDLAAKRVRVADPYQHVPYPGSHHYSAPVARVIGAIYLGIVTYDAKLLIVEPGGHKTGEADDPGTAIEST